MYRQSKEVVFAHWQFYRWNYENANAFSLHHMTTIRLMLLSFQVPSPPKSTPFHLSPSSLMPHLWTQGSLACHPIRIFGFCIHFLQPKSKFLYTRREVKIGALLYNMNPAYPIKRMFSSWGTNPCITTVPQLLSNNFLLSNKQCYLPLPRYDTLGRCCGLYGNPELRKKQLEAISTRQPKKLPLSQKIKLISMVFPSRNWFTPEFTKNVSSGTGNLA